MPQLSRRVQLFTDSVIRRMTRISEQYDAINLSQGYPDFDPPRPLLDRLAQVAYDRYVDKFTDDTLVFYDSDEVTPKEGAKGTAIGHPFRKLAVELGSIQSANFIALGAMMKKTGLLKPESVEQGIAKRFAGKQKVIDSNRKAFEKGLTLE